MFIKNFKITITIILLLLNYCSFAQEITENIEQKTLELFQNKQYKRLIYVGEEAIKNKTDYFFLRFRIGVAYYELGNYRMATHHLEKALVYNSDDPSELEYLYYSYVFSGRITDANYITNKMTEDLKEKIGYKTKFLSNVYVEGGISLSNNISKNAGIDIDDTTNIYGENDMNNNVLYGHVGLKHELSPFLSIYHGFSHIDIEKRKIISIQKWDSVGNYQNFDSVCNYTLTQNEYYINSDIQLKMGLKLTPAFHFIHVSANSLMYQYDTATFIGTFFPTTLNVNNYVVSLAISKEYKRFSLSLFGTYSNLNSAKQIQGGASISYFPFGNLNLYTNTSLVYFYQKKSGGQGQGSSKENRFIFDQMLGLKLFPKLWTEVSVTLGNLANYNEKNAFIVYNIADKINLKAGISFIYSLSSKIELSLRYQFLNRESNYITYQNQQTSILKTINYQNNTIIGGIKWKL